MKKKILITGLAGFIGFHLCKKLIENGYEVLGVDNLNSYYEVSLKNDRLRNLSQHKNSNSYKFFKGDIADASFVNMIFDKFKPEVVINMAAQAGVRYSLENPNSYIKSNILGFSNIIESCKKNNVKHLIYASSSSVYGGNKNLPFFENDGVNHPVSLYAATKRSNELIAHSYSHIYGLPTTGLRLFTVYGPWGRPDMGYFIFTSKILRGETIKIFNNGIMMRDFTYIDDVVESITKLVEKTPHENPNFDYKNPSCSSSWAPFKIFNVGNSSPTNLMDFISNIEEILGITAKKELLPMQPGDVEATSANIKLLNEWIGFKANTNLKQGLRRFINWYLSYYK